MKRKFSIDRIEGDVAVCYDDEQNKYVFSASHLGLERGALFEAELANGQPTNVVYLEQETLETKKQMKQRLDKLFRRRSN